MSLLLQQLPAPEPMKLAMSACLLEHLNPLFQDRNILMLMSLLVICDIETVPKLHSQFYNIMSKYLKRNRNLDISTDLLNIGNCIQSLPKMEKIFII